MNESYILNSGYFGQNYWPNYYFPTCITVVPFEYGEIWTANVTMSMSVLANVVMNTSVTSSVVMNTTVTDTYNELESL